MGFIKFWKVIEINNGIFLELESLQREVFQNSYGKFLDFCLGKFYSYLKWI